MVGYRKMGRCLGFVLGVGSGGRLKSCHGS